MYVLCVVAQWVVEDHRKMRDGDEVQNRLPKGCVSKHSTILLLDRERRVNRNQLDNDISIKE